MKIISIRLLFFISLLLLVSSISTAMGQRLDSSPLPASALDRVAHAWAHKGLGRYMETNCGTQRVTNWPNWEGFEIERCTYNISGKSATVLMLNPEREILIKWAVTSCFIKSPTASEQQLFNCSDSLLKWIRNQSGSQFAIAGIVDEPPAYSFRDGLTVELDIAPIDSWAKPITQAFQDASLNTSFPVRRYGYRARIASTTRDEYRNYEVQYLQRQPTDTNGAKFLYLIRQAYQDAWRRAHDTSAIETVGKYRNDLIAAHLF